MHSFILYMMAAIDICLQLFRVNYSWAPASVISVSPSVMSFIIFDNIFTSSHEWLSGAYMSRLLFMKFLQASFDCILKSYPISNSITMVLLIDVFYWAFWKWWSQLTFLTFSYGFIVLCDLFHINPSEAGAYFTHLPVGQGFQRYRKSFRIGHKPCYSQVNDKEW